MAGKHTEPQIIGNTYPNRPNTTKEVTQVANDVKWIKMVVGMFDGMSFKRIKKAKIGGESFRDKLTAVWFELLDFAGKCNHSGAFISPSEIPFTDLADIATMIDREEEELRLCMSFYVNEGMVEIVDDIYSLTNWSTYQNKEGLDKIREQTRQRVAKHRENKKLLACNVTSNVTVTQSNALDKEEEKEKDNKNKSKKKNNKKEEALDHLFSLLPSFIFSTILQEKLTDWILYKAERKDFYTETGLKSLLRQVEKNCKNYGEQAVVDLIDECMSNLYKGIIFDKLKTAKNDSPKQQTPSETPEFLKKWSV